MVKRLINSKKEMYFLHEFANKVNDALPSKVIYKHINLRSGRYKDTLGRVRYLFEKGIFSEKRERQLWKRRKHINTKNRIKALHPNWSDKKVEKKIRSLKNAHKDYKTKKKEIYSRIAKKRRKKQDYVDDMIEMQDLDNPFGLFFSP